MAVQSPMLSPADRAPLGQYLWTLRKAADMTLRDVEDASDRKVSNAYLSQMETGKIPNPSPAILHEISSVFEARLPKNAGAKCSYERMVELPGHIPPRTAASTKRTSRLAMFESEQLTPEEEDELLKFL